MLSLRSLRGKYLALIEIKLYLHCCLQLLATRRIRATPTLWQLRETHKWIFRIFKEAQRIKNQNLLLNKSSKKSNTRRFSEWRQEIASNNSQIENICESIDKMKAQLQLQHRIDVIRATKKPILQHLIKMNIEPGSRVVTDFVRSPTASSNAQNSKILHQNTAYNFKSTCKQIFVNTQHC